MAEHFAGGDGQRRGSLRHLPARLGGRLRQGPRRGRRASGLGRLCREIARTRAAAERARKPARQRSPRARGATGHCAIELSEPAGRARPLPTGPVPDAGRGSCPSALKPSSGMMIGKPDSVGQQSGHDGQEVPCRIQRIQNLRHLHLFDGARTIKHEQQQRIRSVWVMAGRSVQRIRRVLPRTADAARNSSRTGSGPTGKGHPGCAGASGRATVDRSRGSRLGRWRATLTNHDRSRSIADRGLVVRRHLAGAKREGFRGQRHGASLPNGFRSPVRVTCSKSLTSSISLTCHGPGLGRVTGGVIHRPGSCRRA